jgi:hypothetical protein
VPAVAVPVEALPVSPLPDEERELSEYLREGYRVHEWLEMMTAAALRQDSEAVRIAVAYAFRYDVNIPIILFPVAIQTGAEDWRHELWGTFEPFTEEQERIYL